MANIGSAAFFTASANAVWLPAMSRKATPEPPKALVMAAIMLLRNWPSRSDTV